jgi:hypothetical protein
MQGTGLGGLGGGLGGGGAGDAMAIEGAGGVRVNAQGVVEGLVLTHVSKEGGAGGGGGGSGADGGGDEGGDDEDGHPPALLRPGPVRLAEVRRQLAAAGVETRLVDGAVVTDGGVVVRRGGAADEAGAGFALEMDGPVCAEYFLVRRVLYELFTVV